MAGVRSDNHMVAICIPAAPATLLTEIASNTPANDELSDYSQAGPRPGVSAPVEDLSRLVPVISGSQGADLELVVLTGGNPQLSQAGAVQVGYRFAGEANTKIRGWTAPNWLTGWSAATWTTGTASDATCCTIVDSQKVAVSHHVAGASRYVRVFDPAAGTWNTSVEVRASGDASDSIVCYPGGRLVCLAAGKAYRSDDDGETWTLHSWGVFPDDLPAGTYEEYTDARAAVCPSDSSAVWVALDEGTSTIVQCASDDNFATLTLVKSSTSVGTKPCVVGLPGGGFVIGYRRAADGFPVVRRVSSAWTEYTSADTVEVIAASCTEITLTVDPDGLLWAHYAPTATGGTIAVSVSLDGGITWTALAEGAYRGLSTGDAPAVNVSSCAAGGAVFVAGNWSSSTSATGGSVGLLQFGGWSNLPLSIPGWSTARDWTARSGSGPSATTNAATWIASEKPDNNGWTATGAGASTLVTPGRLDIVTTANGLYYSRAVGAIKLPAICVAEMHVTSGGAVATDDIILRRWVSWAGHEFRMTIRLSSTQIRVIDEVAATTLATVTPTTTTSDIQLLLLVRGENTLDSGAWYKYPSDTTWTTLWTGTLTDDTVTPTTTGGIIWGHRANSTSTSKWQWVIDSDSAVLGQALGVTPAVGRPLGSVPIPLPLETGVDGEGPAWLAAVTGPGVLGEQYDVAADYDYPISNAIPTSSPSPSEHWRSTSRAEQVIAWDHSNKTWRGDSLALVVLEANFQTATLDYHDGTNWVNTGTIDLGTGFSALTASVSGDSITPKAGTASGARYIHENELAGGFVLFADLATDPLKILSNTAGSWTGTSTTPQVRIRVASPTGSEADGSVTLVWPSGVLVVHLAAAVYRRRWRVRIAADQRGPQDYYRAGWLCPMAIRVLGAAPDYGWSRETAPNAETRRTRWGTTRTRKLGPPLRTWALGWPSGVTLRGLRSSSEPDYLGPSGGLPLAAREDVPWLLEGLLDQAQSGQVPVVALATVPATGITVTDPTLFLPGRLTASIRQDQAYGVEGTDELIRVSDIVVEGVV